MVFEGGDVARSVRDGLTEKGADQRGVSPECNLQGADLTLKEMNSLSCDSLFTKRARIALHKCLVE